MIDISIDDREVIWVVPRANPRPCDGGFIFLSGEAVYCYAAGRSPIFIIKRRRRNANAENNFTRKGDPPAMV